MVKQKTRQKGKTLNVILFIVAILGTGLLVYPQAADWISSLNHNAEISGYVKSVEATPSERRQAILDAGYEYNDQLEPGPLADPYITENQNQALRTNVYQAYEKLLRVTGSDAIGTVNYPSLDIALPIYHGTEDDTISKGAGHLYGTSLPIGGPSTHSVLTAHSGLHHSKLFTNLLKAKEGDTFWISVLGEDHYYQVRKTETVLPGQTESLKIIENEDWVTLFTCTPIGVNSHRYMVYAERIADPDKTITEDYTIGGDGVIAGFPWWAVWFTLGIAGAWWLLLAPPRKRKKDDKNTETKKTPRHAATE